VLPQAITLVVPNYFSVSKKVIVLYQVIDFSIDQIKIFFENLTVQMERDIAN
jgi:hypothetical protein